jgi:dienelactone hydrolase
VALVVVLAAGALLGAGCSDDAGPDRAAAASPSADKAAAGAASTAKAPPTTAAPETFTGSVDDFYRVPDPLPKGRPGQLIRVQAVKADATAVTVRVMYHSRDVTGDDRAVTGIITYPVAAPPTGGWPVVAWAHGTSGLSTRCAPSRAGGAAPGFGITGVHAATDYIGLGPVGERHGYLVGAAEAHAVIDSVRAARNLTAAHAGTRWAAVGHSQGGHSALFTNQLGEKYAPELDLVGTVAIAPAAELTRTFGPADDIVPRMVGIMALYGAEAEYPQIDADDYVGPEVAAKASIIDTGCSDDVIAAMAPIPKATFYAHDPLTTPPASTVLRRNNPGQVRVASPLLVVYGTTDWYVVPDRVHALFDRLCSIHQVTALVEIAGAGHGPVVPMSAEPVRTWLQARFDGTEAPDDCPAPS